MLRMDSRQIKIIVGLGIIIVALIFFIALGGKIPGQNNILEDETIAKGIAKVGDVSRKPDDINSSNIDGQEEPKKNHPIVIYLAGQVKTPGVIEVPEGCRLNDAVNMAGGFLEEADLLKINLAIKVQDEGMYYIPKIGEEVPELLSPTILSAAETTDKININTADQIQLETLPRIGPVMSQNIINYREENGPFKEIEDIKNVSGIGEKTFEGLKDLIITK